MTLFSLTNQSGLAILFSLLLVAHTFRSEDLLAQQQDKLGGNIKDFVPSSEIRNARAGLVKNPNHIPHSNDLSSDSPNPIEKIFKSEDVEIDRNTLERINAETQHPETFKDRVLEVTTFLEGDLDPEDNIKVTTRIKDYKNNEITYITPSFERIDGRLNYSHSVLQEESSGVYRIRGASKSDVQGEGSLGLHIQQFEAEKERDNQELFSQYAAFLQTYIQYLYKYNVDIKSEHLKDLEASFVYFGSLANGQNPSLESTNTNNFKKIPESQRDITPPHKTYENKDSVFETVTGSEGPEDSTISYGVSNQISEEKAHGFQNMVATAAGKEPLSGLQIQIFKEDKFIRGSIIGQSLAKPSLKEAMTTVDAVGNNSGLGFTDNTTFSRENEDMLGTASEMNNLSIAEKSLDRHDVVILGPSPDSRILPGVFKKQDVSLDNINLAS